MAVKALLVLVSLLAGASAEVPTDPIEDMKVSAEFSALMKLKNKIPSMNDLARRNAAYPDDDGIWERKYTTYVDYCGRTSAWKHHGGRRDSVDDDKQVDDDAHVAAKSSV